MVGVDITHFLWRSVRFLRGHGYTLMIMNYSIVIYFLSELHYYIHHINIPVSKACITVNLYLILIIHIWGLSDAAGAAPESSTQFWARGAVCAVSMHALSVSMLFSFRFSGFLQHPQILLLGLNECINVCMLYAHCSQNRLQNHCNTD